MDYYFSATHNTFYPGSMRDQFEAWPADAVEVTAEEWQTYGAGSPPEGMQRKADAAGRPVWSAIEVPPVTQESLCAQIDRAADAAREAVAGDPLRAVEYERAALEAQAFADAGYQGEVPPMVAAWAINGRTPQQAADSILGEAAQYNAALVQIRTVRLQAKERIRSEYAAGHAAVAKSIADETIATIEAAVAGIGNNAG